MNNESSGSEPEVVPLDFGTSGKTGEELRELASYLLEEGLCPRCIGRFFARCGRGLENTERGKEFLTEFASGDAIPAREGSCSLCNGLFMRTEAFAEIVTEELREVESENFLVGTIIDYAISDREKEITKRFGITCSEPMKSEMNRLVGKTVALRIERQVEFGKPEAVALLDSRFGTVSLQISPVFIGGRYRKFSREIPQTKWFCRKCRGKGCSHCQGTGKMYAESVEELIGKHALDALDGEEHFFHGMGREDIDARMLGNGRPFVLEVRNPVKRTTDLEKMAKAINSEVSGKIEDEALRFVPRSSVALLKNARPEKTYRMEVEFDEPVDMEKLKNVMGCLAGLRIIQRTPVRVAHRRADIQRERMVYHMDGRMLDASRAELEMKGEAGIYIKELVSGDSGRTVPSVAELANVQCRVTSLDVIHIHDDDQQSY